MDIAVYGKTKGLSDELIQGLKKKIDEYNKAKAITGMTADQLGGM
jgi:hypothetical protein